MTDSPDDAAKALDDFAQGPAKDAANDVAEAFEFAGERIAKALEKAARSGEFSFTALAETLTRDFARLAINELITKPLEGLVSDIGGKVFGGSAQPKPTVTVNMTINNSSGPSGTSVSDGQMAARVAQAVARGQTRI